MGSDLCLGGINVWGIFFVVVKVPLLASLNVKPDYEENQC